MILGDGRFDSLGYKVVEQDGKQGLLITAVEKPYAPPTVQPLLLIDGSDYLNPVFAIGGRITLYDVGGFGRELRNDIILGAEYGVSSSITSRCISAATGSSLRARSHRILHSTNTTRTRRRRIPQSPVWRRVRLRLRIWPRRRAASRLPGCGSQPVAAHRISHVASGKRPRRFHQSQLRNESPRQRRHPRAGTALFSEWRWNDANPGAKQQFATARANFRYFKRVRKPDSIFLTAQGGTTFGAQQVGLPIFGLGGSNDLHAYGTNELLTNQYYYFREVICGDYFPCRRSSATKFMSSAPTKSRSLSRSFLVQLGPVSRLPWTLMAASSPTL